MRNAQNPPDPTLFPTPPKPRYAGAFFTHPCSVCGSPNAPFGVNVRLLKERLVHKPFLTGDRGDIVGFYAVAKLKGGGVQFEFMSLSEVIAVRDGSSGWATAKRFGKEAKSPWGASFSEMGRKTVIRRLCKYLPMSVELATAIAIDTKADEGAPVKFDDSIAGEFTIVSDDQPDPTHDPETGVVYEPEPEPVDEKPKRQRSPAPAPQPAPQNELG